MSCIQRRLWSFGVLLAGVLLLQALAAGVALAVPGNDNFANMQHLYNGSGTTTGTTTGATREVGEPGLTGIGGTVWYRFIAPSDGKLVVETRGSSYDTMLGVYAGANLTNLDQLAKNDDAGGASSSFVAVDTKAQAVYYIQVDGYGGSTGNFKLSWSHFPSRPVNDDFSDATSLYGTWYSLPVCSAGASGEPGEPRHGGNPVTASVWYKWRAAESGTVTIGVPAGTPSTFDPIVAVYTGDSLSNLACVAWNDDRLIGTREPRLVFEAQAGRTYYVAVDGFGGSNGVCQMTLAQSPLPPANDDFEAAQSIYGNSGAVSTSNSQATTQAGEPFHLGYDALGSVWYQWKPAVTAPVTFTASIHGGVAIIAPYTGSSITSLTPVTLKGGSVGGYGYVSFNAEAGVTYRIAVASYVGAGEMRMSWTTPAPTTLTLAGATAPAWSTLTTLTATLGTDRAGIAGKQLLFEQLSGTTWSVIATGTTNALGVATVNVTPSTRTSYRARFISAEREKLLSSTAKTLVVAPKVGMDVPYAPSSVRLNTSFLAYGGLRPRHTAGTKPVQLQCYLKVGTSWVLKKTVYAKVANSGAYSQYSASLSLPTRGSWAIRAYHPQDTAHAATYTGYRYITVK